MRRSIALALLALLLLSLYVRLIPVTQYLYWGGDFGEYFGLTRTVFLGQPLPDAYLGWGVTYPEFPGMFVVNAAVAWTGIPLEAAAVLLVPLLAALVVVPVFLLTREVTHRDGAALLAAAVIAVISPHAYPTAHAMPGALGDLLFVTGLLLLIRLRSDARILGLLIPLAIALAPIHHLSSYFLIIATFLVASFRVLLQRAAWRDIRRETGFLAFLVAVNVTYWMGYADTFRLFLGFERVPPILTAGFLVLLPFALYPLARLRARITWQYRPRFPPVRRAWQTLLIASIFVGGLLLFTTLFQVPGTNIPTAASTLLFALPFLPLLLLGAAGRKPFDFLPQGPLITAGFLALLISWIIGSTVAPNFLVPYRHFEYMAPFMAAFAGIGAVLLLRVTGVRVLVPVLVGLIILAAATAIPPREAIANHFEGTRPEALGGVEWAGGRPLSLTATDHRVSSILFGFVGVAGTFDTVSAPLHAPTFEAARGEMVAMPGRERIDFVFLDQDMIAGASLFPWDPAFPLSPEAQAKFVGPHYLRLYDDGYAQIYWVNWGIS
ncbi:MAG: hypothetical protein ACE5JE_06505 [Thermoplasmata archaeon]